MPYPSELCWLQFDAFGLLERVRDLVPDLPEKRVQLTIENTKTLAHISASSDVPVLTLHPILNHETTPETVIEYIFQHELVHLVVPPRVVDGRLRTHPPEFIELETTLCRNRSAAWTWLSWYFGSCLLPDKDAERVIVRRGWRKLVRRPERYEGDLDVFLKNIDDTVPSERAC